ncbi:MAG TPA: hypothetical protein VNH18_04120 [Bryobacteraceae bacterium]|nr:hypothetical protein [Bryobacteraceae bacterium]
MDKRIAVLALMLAGCVSVSEKLTADLRPFIGSDIKKLSAWLGYPDSKREMFGDTIYTWSTDHRSTMTLPTFTQTTGDIGGTPFSATTQGTEDVPLHFFCTLTVATDEKGIVKNFSFKGNNAGCAKFAKALEPN